MDARYSAFLTALFLLTGSIFFLVEIYYLTPLSR